MLKVIYLFLLLLSANASAGFVRSHKWSCQLLLAEVSLNSEIAKYSDAHHPIVFEKLLELRYLKRSGWLKRGVPQSLAEDVFIHTVKVARTAEIISMRRPSLDRDKLLRMILIHDIAELGKIGDVTPSDGISREQKIKGEEEALTEFYAQNPEAFIGVFELWQEFEGQQSQEAILASQLDKIDAGIQAIRYEKLGYPTQDFYPYVQERISDPFLASTFNLVLNTRLTSEDPYLTYFEILATEH